MMGRKVVITGAAGIYGRELSQAFAKDGATLCLSDRRADALAELAKSLGLPAGRIMTHATDLMDEASVADLIAAVTRAWSAPDVVVNNAGVYPFGGLLDIDVGHWNTVMDTNLRAPFLIMQGFAKAMLSHRVKGCFVNISSGAADVLRTNGVPYCVSKRALEWLSKGFALDLAHTGIRVNCVQPGLAVGSEMVDFPPGYVETMARQHPMGRNAEPGDLPAAVLYLASDAAGYVTGHSLAVNGGGTIPHRAGMKTSAQRPG